MKKILFVLMGIVAFVGCSSDDEYEPSFNEKQQKALNIFNGTWMDKQFAEPFDIITFEKKYEKPVSFHKDDYMNGKEYLFDAHGECTYKNWNYSTNTYDETPCYFRDKKQITYNNILFSTRIYSSILEESH